MTVSTFPPGVSFIRALAEHIFLRRDKSRMAETVILLPTRRACRNLKEALQQRLTDASLILPRIFAIADIESDPIFFAELVGIEHVEQLVHQRIMSPLERRCHLAKLCSAISIDGQPLNSSRAFELADALGQLLDELQRQQIPLDKLEQLSPELYSEHWQDILKFLRIITTYWPDILKQQNALDPIAVRNELFQKLADLWQQQPPDMDIIIAGSTGSNLATARLMRSVVRLKRGEVILPSFPTNLIANEWKQVQESHPFFFMKRFLELAKLKPEDVVVHVIECSEHMQARLEMCERALLPAPLIHQWPLLKFSNQALHHLQYISTQTPHDEALEVALVAKEAVEQGLEDMSIVVENDHFREALLAHLVAFNLKADASESQTLADAPLASFLDIVAQAAENPADPLNILAFFKHPHTHMQRARIDVLDAARYMELHLFRTSLHVPTLQAMMQALQSHSEPIAATAHLLLQTYAEAIAPMQKLMASHQANFNELFTLHLQLAEKSSLTPEGLLPCWELGDDGQARDFIQDLTSHAPILGTIDPFHYRHVLKLILQKEPWRQVKQEQYRLRILPAEEARLQPAELMIITEMNEGTWPKLNLANPWMSRPMQAAIGLLVPEAEASQKAHDLLMLMSADKVIFTRARSEDRAETIESRWLQRLNAYLSTNELSLEHLQTSRYLQQRLELLKPADIPRTSRPTPTPPVAARPLTFSITDIELLQRDPYAIYAKNILKLKPLESLSGITEQQLYGNVAHRLLELWAKAYPNQLPTSINVEPLIDQALNEKVHEPNLVYMWKRKLTKVMEWVLSVEQERRGEVKSVAAEIKLNAEIQGVHGSYQIHGRLDRLEVMHHQHFRVIDYKTGSAPTAKHMQQHVAGQLAIASWMLLKNWPEDIAEPGAQAEVGEYWKLGTTAAHSKMTPQKSLQEKEFLEESEKHVLALLDAYMDAAQAYLAVPDRTLAPKYNAYDQLERYAEWA